MLVLSRKVQERLCIGDNIEITVLSIRGGRVRLGIACPQVVPVRRSELTPIPRGDDRLPARNPRAMAQVPSLVDV